MRKYLILCLVAITFQVKSQIRPMASADAIVQKGNVRFTVLTDGLIRLEWSENGKFEDQASLIFINRNLPVPKFTKKDNGKVLEISTSKLSLKYKSGSGKFSEENLQISSLEKKNKFSWKPGTPNDGNLLGTTRTLDGWNGNRNSWNNDTMKLEEGILSRDGWYLFDDSKSLLFNNSEWNWVQYRPEGDRQDWYFFGYGKDFKSALKDYTKVAGKIPMPPRWAFGYWWSRYWEYSDKELRNLLANMEMYDIPLDVLVIDMDWHTETGYSPKNDGRDEFGEGLGWTGYTWNRDLFPDPGKFFQWTDEKKLKITMNIHPASGVPVTEERYAEFASAMEFDTAGKKYVPFEIADKNFAEKYFNILLRPLEKQGVDFWWLDWQQWKYSKKMPELSNTWWLNYCHFTDAERNKPNRPILYHRWGGMGNHRYQIGFSGDALITWQSLAFQPYFTATASNVGYGYWSHDIGGHMWGGLPKEQRVMNPELNTRWFQYGVFSPILRSHSSKDRSIYKEMWLYPYENFKASYDFLQLRYALVPYIYTASRQAYDDGISLCRPMYYDYPEDKDAYNVPSEYMFGNDMIVTAITAPSVNGLSSVRVWLPKGQWYEWFTGTMLEGGKYYERTFLLDEYPVFLKTGAVIPMYPKVKNLKQAPYELVLSVFPGKTYDAKLYEDQGDDKDYITKYAFTKFKKETSADGTMVITVSPREGSFEGADRDRGYHIKVIGCAAPAAVVVDGLSFRYSPQNTPMSYNYTGNDLTTHIYIPRNPVNAKMLVQVKYNEEAIKNSAVLNGKIGKLKKIRIAGDFLRKNTSIPADMMQTLRVAEQTGTRIDYTPLSSVRELQQLDKLSLKLIEDIQKLEISDEVKKQFAEYLK
jgi:alpha-glucosidase (family GH31 glycosyl hydrolase)